MPSFIIWFSFYICQRHRSSVVMETEVSRELVTAADVCFVRHMIKFLAFFSCLYFCVPQSLLLFIPPWRNLCHRFASVVYRALAFQPCFTPATCELATGGLSEKALILEENKEINIFFNAIPAKDKANVKEEQLKQYEKI